VFSVRFRVCSRKQNHYKLSLQTSEEGAIKSTYIYIYIYIYIFDFYSASRFLLSSEKNRHRTYTVGLIKGVKPIVSGYKLGQSNGVKKSS